MTPMDLFTEFTDPRLVALYDTVCPFGEDFAFYLDLAAALGTESIVDIGCGTGMLTVELARPGRRVIGVDPSGPMLAVARSRPGGDLVQWTEGGVEALGVLDASAADLVVMTRHVAQIIADDDLWHATLAAARDALRPGGRVAFESRHPRSQPWGPGRSYAPHRRFDEPGGGAFEMWQEVVAMRGDRTECELHYRFADSGDELVSRNVLRFRTEPELARDLVDAGFSVERVYGDWDRRPVSGVTAELIFVAARS